MPRILLLLSGLFLLLGWLLPSHFRPWAAAYQELLTAISLLLALWSLLWLQERQRLPVASLLVCLIACIPFVQHISGLVLYSGDAWISAAYILAFAISTVLAFNLQRTDRNVLSFEFATGLAWVLLLGGLISAVLAAYQWLGAGPSDWVFRLKPGARASANIAQPNNLATLLGMSLASLVYLFEQRKLPRLFAALLAGLLLCGIVLSQSRTPWLVAVFIMVFWAWQRKRLSLRLTNLHVAGWVVLYVAMILTLPVLAELLGLSVELPLDRARQTSRLLLYSQFFQAVLQGPWYGYGWNQVFTAQASVMMEQYFLNPTIYTHNIILDLLIWNGPVLGGVIVLGAAFWLWRLLLKANSLTATFAWLALGFVIFHSMLEFPHAYLFLLIPAGLLLGVLQASANPSETTWALPKWLLAVVALAGTAITGLFWHDYGLIEREHLASVVEKNDKFVDKNSQAITGVYLTSQMREYTYYVRLPLKPGYSADQLDELRVAAKRYPHFYFLLKSAYIMALNERPDEAYTYLMTIPRIYSQQKLEQALAYLLDQSDEQSQLLPLLKLFNIQPESQPDA